MRAANDVIRSRDLIGHVTIRLSIDDFLYILNGDQTRISLILRRILFDRLTPSPRDRGDRHSSGRTQPRVPLTG